MSSSSHPSTSDTVPPSLVEQWKQSYRGWRWRAFKGSDDDVARILRTAPGYPDAIPLQYVLDSLYREECAQGLNPH